MKQVIFIVLALLIIAGGVYLLVTQSTITSDRVQETNETDATTSDQTDDTVTEDTTTPVATETDTTTPRVATIGASSEGRAITVHTFGTGATDILVVGGMHGAYAPNTTALAEEIIAEAGRNPQFVPEGITLHVIPVLNPDGLATDASPEGRFNANSVDLNRNFDCEWKPAGTWQNRTVSGGSTAFSEPETAALRDYVARIEPEAAIVYYAAAGGVFASNCRNGVTAATLELTNIYAEAADYSANESFDFYEITGDAVNWMAKERIPAISVLLSGYESTEWEQNQAGLRAVMDIFAQ